MNNFYLGEDPILNQYQMPQTVASIRDTLGELQNLLRTVDEDTRKELMDNKEYVDMYNDLQSTIQIETINLIRNRINTCPQAVSQMNKQIEIIKKTIDDVKAKNRDSLLELNDYIKNYSALSFDEYRELKRNENK